MDKKEILSAYNFRHACKEFDPNKKISNDDFNFIIETARLSPSSFGFEPWKFLVVQNKELREKLTEHTWGGQGQIPTCSHLVVCLAKKSQLMRFDSAYISDFMKNIQQLPKDIVEMKTGFYKSFQENDFKLLESERALFDWSSKQCYIALGNMLTGAALIGIDSCPMEGFDPDKINATLAQQYDVDLNKYGVAYMAAFGYRANDPAPKTRQEIQNIAEWVE